MHIFPLNMTTSLGSIPQFFPLPVMLFELNFIPVKQVKVEACAVNNVSLYLIWIRFYSFSDVKTQVCISTTWLFREPLVLLRQSMETFLEASYKK